MRSSTADSRSISSRLGTREVGGTGSSSEASPCRTTKARDAVARSGRANQRSSKLRPPSRSTSAATAVFGAAPGSSSTRTCAPRDAALFSASIRRRSLKRGAANPISSPAAAAPSASSSAPRIAPSVRNRASMEPGPRGTAGGGAGKRSSPLDHAAISSWLATMSRARPSLICSARSPPGASGKRLTQPPAPSSATKRRR